MRLKAVVAVSAALALGLAAASFLFSEKSSGDDGAGNAIEKVAAPKGLIAGSGFGFASARLPTLEEAARETEERNRENVARMAAFEEEGWEAVEVDDPPDEELMNLSPSLVGAREGELQMQIQSNSFSAEMLPRLSGIALATQDEKTRYVALEALGRSDEGDARLLLMDAFDRIDDEESRSQILGYLMPANTDDEIATFLREQVADPALSRRLRLQASFPLAVAALLETSGAGEAVQAAFSQMPSEATEEFSSVIELLAEGGQEARR